MPIGILIYKEVICKLICHNGTIVQKEVACTGEAWSRDGDRVGACRSPRGSSWQPRADMGRERGDLGWKLGSRPPAAVLVSPGSRATSSSGLAWLPWWPWGASSKVGDGAQIACDLWFQSHAGPLVMYKMLDLIMWRQTHWLLFCNAKTYAEFYFVFRIPKVHWNVI